jgi:hypothetical protein
MPDNRADDFIIGFISTHGGSISGWPRILNANKRSAACTFEAKNFERSMPQTTLTATPGVNVGPVSLGQRAVVAVTGGTLVVSGIDAETVPGEEDWLLEDSQGGLVYPRCAHRC